MMATPAMQPLPISIATPSRDSMPFTSTKGLLNGPGQNNCFLNSAVQVLWHLDIFRRSFRDLSGHACMADSCIFCALKELFSQLQFSTETALPPDALRRALAESFFDQQRFQLGFMDDAAECFENMLLRIHMHIAHGEAEDMCNAKHCIPHQKFAMTLVEQSICESCGATSEPLSYTQMVHYVSTSTLVYQVRANNGRPQNDTFGQLLRKAGNMGDVRVCPSACGAVIQIGRTLMNHPEIVSIGLVWNSERPSLEHIMEVFSTIGTTLRLGDVFNTVGDNRWSETSIHNLVGVVTYYGKHYSTFFFHTKLRVWIYFDDATVREVGPRWDQVVEKCRKGRYQPLLLLYALPDGTPVNTENAPKQITAFYNDKVTKKPPQSVLRRSVTPSPEKPIIGNTRRAITPNPDGSLNQKPPLPRPYNEYQNLSVIQKNIYETKVQSQEGDVVDGCLNRKEPEYVSKRALDFTQPLQKPQVNIFRTLSSGSSSGVEGMSIPDHMNVPRRRDSGNWSGDRNSASSSSSTTMENPYLYLVGKVPHGGGSVPGSPTRSKSDSSSGSSGVYDAGYDSYSLSSNDSSTMTTLQHLMKMGHLAQIPEDYNNTSNQVSQSCDVLCDEADELLVKSRQLEDEHDLVLALALCNAAATKARAAMNAPYNNPQTLTLARMKHNTCIMRARGLHRRMTQTQNMQNKDNPPEIRHTREGSSGSGRHSRQNSRDKGLHSRQNSRELLVTEKEKVQPTKNIEIYATLPKKKDALKSKLNSIQIEDNNEYALYDKPPNRESRSIFSRSKNKESHKIREKRSRSEDRNKITRDFSIAPEISNGKDTLKKAKDEKEDKKEKDGKQKKQHKIRRKLLMGGLIKRKNRSMPDLTDANAVDNETSVHQVPTTTVDDSNIGLKGNLDNQTNNMCGYLSEGHLEFSGNNTNPNLERSKLMRKSFHGSAGKILTAAKVPPPPPLRTTSQLSKAKSNGGEVCEEKSERPQYPLPNNVNHYQNTQYYDVPPTQKYKPELPVSLPYISNYQNYDYNSNQASPYNSNTIVTRADVHQEQSPLNSNYNNDSGVDEVDCLPSAHRMHNLDLPPYPSPIGSAVHSRQASEEFPPPPPPLDLSALEEDLPKPSPPPTPSPGSLLAQLQDKRQQILTQDPLPKRVSEPVKSSGETWLRELQAKQAALRLKKSQNTENNIVTEDSTNKVETKNTVKDLASKFEICESTTPVKPLYKSQQNSFDLIKTDSSIHNGVLSLKKREEHEPIAPEQIAEEIREVELLNAAVHKTLNGGLENEESKKTRLGKKKSVSFCDQVILVATAEEQEDDSYIPNPILERVLRTAMTKPETTNIRQEIINLREADGEEEDGDVVDGIRKCVEEEKVPQQPLYVRRNSIDNLLNRPNSSCGNEQVYNQNNHYSIQNQQIIHQSPINSPNAYHNSPNSLYNYPQPPYTNQNGYNNNNSPYNGGYNVQNSYGSNQIIPQDTQQYTAQNNSHHAYPPTSQYGSYNNHNAPYTTSNNIQNGQYNGHTAYRQSPYQPLPQNSPAYTAYYANKANTIQNPRQSQDYHTQQYSPSQRNGFNQQTPQIRQSTPSPMHVNNYPNTPIYHHPPSPAPSNVSSNYNYSHRLPPNNNYDNSVQYSPYQRVPMPEQRTANHIETDTYHRHPKYIQDRLDPYQRVPPPHHEQDTYIQNNNGKYSPYQQALIPKQILKKTVSFEPGTKGGCESPTPKAVITPIIVNNANNSVPTDKTKCNLCRKKNVVAANLYCTDCEFYMSRFKPRC